MKEFIITWNIENVTYSWHKTGEYIASPQFTAWPMRQTVWTLRLYPRGCDDSDYLSLYVHREDEVAEDIAVNFEFSCIASDASLLHSCTIPDTFMTFPKGDNSDCGKPQFMKRHEVFGRKSLYLPRDTLRLLCKMWNDEGNANESYQIFGLTRLKLERTSAISIYNKTEAESPFLIKSLIKNKPILNTCINYFDNYIDVAIHPHEATWAKFGTLEFSFVNKRSRRKLCGLEKCFFGDSVIEKWRLPFSDQRLPTKKSKSDGREFELEFEIVYSTGQTYKKIEENCPPQISEFLSYYICDRIPDGEDGAIPTIFDNLAGLREENLFFDFELKTEKASLPVHKIMLCAYSSVFSSMLKGEMKESIYACIEMTDKALSPFVTFLYTDILVCEDYEDALDLYYVAVKYEMERLKLFCCSHLMKNIDISKVYYLLKLADRHSDHDLKRKVNDFIWEKEDEIFRSSVWEEFASERPDLVAETMRHQEEKHGPSETYEDQIARCPKLREAFKTFDYSQGDVLIETQGSPLPAYKSVLCACSSFREEFNEDLRKDTIASLHMRDLDGDTAKRMLDFLHNDSLEGINWDIAMTLYHVGIEYGIKNLEDKCVQFLLENLKVSNAVQLLESTHQDCHRLKKLVQDFIVMHDKEVFGSSQWAVLSRKNPVLASQTMLRKYFYI